MVFQLLPRRPAPVLTFTYHPARTIIHFNHNLRFFIRLTFILTTAYHPTTIHINLNHNLQVFIRPTFILTYHPTTLYTIPPITYHLSKANIPAGTHIHPNLYLFPQRPWSCLTLTYSQATHTHSLLPTVFTTTHINPTLTYSNMPPLTITFNTNL